MTEQTAWDHPDRDRLTFLDDVEAFEAVPTGGFSDDEDSDEIIALHEGRIVVDAIHSGDVIPAEFRESIRRAGQEDLVARRYAQEKDWGADHLAHELARQLRLPESYRVSVARAILDFGRFPGTTRRGSAHMHRFAINRPFSECLRHSEKRRLLERYYDRISEGIDDAVRDKHIKLSIHTYDRFNPLPRDDARYASEADGRRVGTERPQVSLVFGSHGYHNETEMPYGVFDELFPDELGELTADRKLTARILLEVANEGLSVTHNHPYLLPEGSVEVRSQVWFFFDYLRRRFETAHPETTGDDAYRRVWAMLLDTNLRRSDSEILRSYLHGFRKAPTGMESECEHAGVAYGAIREFTARNGESILEEYRYGSHTERPSSLVIELRKDFLWRFEDERGMFEPKPGRGGLIRENVDRMARLLKDAVLTYLRDDR
jgi:hypothetical protein